MAADSIVKALLDSDEDLDVKDYLAYYRVKYLVFAAGSGPYGSGGWSRNARHRPQPTVVSKDTKNVVFQGKSVIVDGVRRLKCNVWTITKQPVRIDYPDLKYD